MLNLQTPDAIRAAMSDDTFRILCRETDEAAELLIAEEIGEDWIGEGLSAKDVVAFLDGNKGTDVHVRINSPGGLVYDGLQIYNALSSHDSRVEVTIEGLAYSAASFIAMAGDHIRMYAASDLGIHRAWGIAMGNAVTMRDTADWLETIDGHLIDIYTARTGQPQGQIERWLDGDVDGTVFSAEQAVTHGFADELIPLKTKRNEAAASLKDTATRRIRARHQARLARLRQA